MYPRRYPANFKSLNWWEEREVDGMPKYLIDNSSGSVFKVVKYSGTNIKLVYVQSDFNFYSWIKLDNHIQPSTKEEYDDND